MCSFVLLQWAISAPWFISAALFQKTSIGAEKLRNTFFVSWIMLHALLSCVFFVFIGTRPQNKQDVPTKMGQRHLDMLPDWCLVPASNLRGT